MELAPGRIEEIQAYLMRGTNHMCHVTNKVCRGGREFQAQVFHRMNIISHPTVYALEKELKEYNKRKGGEG